MGLTNEHCDLGHVEEFLKETEPGSSFFPPDHLSQLSKEFEHDFPQRAREWIRDPFVNKPKELTSVQEEYQLLDGDLKSTLETTSDLHTSGLKSRWNNLRLPPKR